MHRPTTSGAGPAVARRGRGGGQLTGSPGSPDDPGSSGRRGRNGRKRLRDRLWARITAAVLAAFLLVVGWSVGHALTMPGGGTLSERLAEWARGHYLGPLVTFGEWVSYSPPKSGGKPSFALTGPSAQAAKRSEAAADKAHAAAFAPPAPIKPLAGALPHEGQWRSLAVVNGQPAIFGTYLRASRVYSSYVAGVASMNPNLVKFSLHPGTEDPGPGNWKSATYIKQGSKSGLLATFNSGFKINVSGGGFYLNGAHSGALVNGAASEVYYKNGRLAIGVWGKTLHMTPDVVGVRQNLHPIVSNGKVPASVNHNVTTQWGATLGGGYYVWRSGIGVTRTGRIVFVYGPALNVQELASLLQRAGAVTAMQLDINPDWMSYMYYLPKLHPANPSPVNLLPNQMQPPTRYFTPASRDFTAVYAR